MEEGRSTTFGQVVVGPPGSGKSTYCRGVCEFLNGIGRPTVIVNLDPANEALPYEAAVNVEDLVSLAAVMEEHQLGPNGGIMYCLEYLEVNLDWLTEQLAPHAGKYLLFDLPGQVELFTHHGSLRRILDALTFKTTLRLAVVNLVDAHHISDPTKYVAVLLTSLSTMLQLEMPHVNVFSKVDLIEQYGQLSFGLDYYTQVLDLSYLGDAMPDQTIPARFKRLTQALAELVEDFSMVRFKTLHIEDRASVAALVREVDRANGYLYGLLESERLLGVIDAAALGNDEFDVARKYIHKE